MLLEANSYVWWKSVEEIVLFRFFVNFSCSSSINFSFFPREEYSKGDGALENSKGTKFGGIPSERNKRSKTAFSAERGRGILCGVTTLLKIGVTKA